MGADFKLADALDQASVGDFLVTLQDRTATLLIVSDVGAHQIVFQEISSPVECGSGNWPDWLSRGAPGHTSWTAYVVGIGTGRVERAYSFSRNGWLDLRGCDPFLTTLLCLPLKPIPTQERRKAGPAPLVGPDRRALWQPPLIVNGRRVPQASFEAYRSLWPRDGSALAGREIILYLPREKGAYPHYFPNWIEVNLGLKDSRLRMIDSGQGLAIPRSNPIRAS